MIPFHLFDTPQDAYEWAKANAHRCAFRRGPRGWEVSVTFFPSSPLLRSGWATETLLPARVRR